MPVLDEGKSLPDSWDNELLELLRLEFIEKEAGYKAQWIEWGHKPEINFYFERLHRTDDSTIHYAEQMIETISNTIAFWLWLADAFKEQEKCNDLSR